MFKPGSQFIVEVESVYEAMPDQTTIEVPKVWNHLYRIKGFSTCIFDAWGLSNLQWHRPMKGPYGIGCVVRVSRPRPKNRAEMKEWRELGWPETYPEHNAPWMITEVEKLEDGKWMYHGIKKDGEAITIPGDTKLTYLDLHFNTVVEWAKYDGEIK